MAAAEMAVRRIADELNPAQHPPRPVEREGF
jgi:hypothetical protein